MDRTKLLTTCDKCHGNGLQFIAHPGTAFQRQRIALGLTQREVCAKVGISDNTQLSRFEHNRFRFSEERLRALEAFYVSKETK